MSFSDNFNRSDSSLSASANWTSIDYQGQTMSAGNASDFQFVNNKLVGGVSSAWALAYVNTSVDTFADDQEATVFISDIVSSRAAISGQSNLSSNNMLGVAVRVTSTGACYIASIDPFGNGLGGLLYLPKPGQGQYYLDLLYDDYVDPSSSHWSNAVGGSWTDTDAPNKLTLRVHGNVLTVLVNDVIQEIFDVTQTLGPSELITSGQPGIYHEGYAGSYTANFYDFAMDNFSAISNPPFVDDFSRDSNASQSIESSPNWVSPVPGLKVKNGRVALDELPIQASAPFLVFSCLANISGANQVVNYSYTTSTNDLIQVMPAVRVNPSTGACYYAAITSSSGSNTLTTAIFHSDGTNHNQMTGYSLVNGVNLGDTIDISFRANGDILTVLINGSIAKTTNIGVNRIDSGNPGIIAANNAGDTNTTIGLDEFTATMYYDDPVVVPIATEYYLSMVGRTTNLSNSITDHDENAFYEAEELVGSSFTPTDTDNDGDLSDEPPALEVFDPYYSSGRYNYRVLGDWGTNFKDTIFSGSGSQFDLTPNKTLPPIVAKRSGTTNSESAFHLLVFPEGRNNHANSIYVAGSAPSISYRILSSSGQLIDDSPDGYSSSPSYYGVPYQSVPANKARNIYVQTSFGSIGGLYDKYEDLNLPADDITVLKDDLSTQTFTSFTDLSSASDVSSILEYPLGPNYVILEYTITVGFFNTATTENTESTIVLTQRVYEDPENSVANIQSINTPGTGDPDNLPDLPGGD